MILCPSEVCDKHLCETLSVVLYSVVSTPNMGVLIPISSHRAESTWLEKEAKKKNQKKTQHTSTQSHLLTTTLIILVTTQDIPVHTKAYMAIAEQWESLRSDASSTGSKINSYRKLTPLCIKAGGGGGGEAGVLFL